MVEGGYITPVEFMKEVLEYALHLGMTPPIDGIYPYSTHSWTPEDATDETPMDKWANNVNKTLNKKPDDDDSGNFPCGAV